MIHNQMERRIKGKDEDEISVIEAFETSPPEKLHAEKKGKELVNLTFERRRNIYGLNALYLILIVTISVLWSFPATVIPMNNTILFPGYWWEWIVTGTYFTMALYRSISTLIDFNLIFNLRPSKMLVPFIRFYLVEYLSTVSITCACYLIWTTWLKFNHPIPMLGILLYLIPNVTHLTAIWFTFPREMKKTQDGREKIQGYMFYRLWYIFYAHQQIALNIVMGKLPPYIQWVMAFIIPIVRESNVWMMEKILGKTIDSRSDVHPIVPVLNVTICMSITYAFWAAQVISSAASSTTGYCLLAVDFLLNCYNTYNITKLHRKIGSIHEVVDALRRKAEMTEEALKLAGAEIVEFLVPIIYIITFLMAFYGPNRNLHSI